MLPLLIRGCVDHALIIFIHVHACVLVDVRSHYIFFRCHFFYSVFMTLYIMYVHVLLK